MFSDCKRQQTFIDPRFRKMKRCIKITYEDEKVELPPLEETSSPILKQSKMSKSGGKLLLNYYQTTKAVPQIQKIVSRAVHPKKLFKLA